MAEGSPRALIEQYATREVLELRFPPGGPGATWTAGSTGSPIASRHLPDRLLLYTADGDAAAVAVHERGLRPEQVLVRRSTLEDVFLRLTGRTLVE